MLSSRYGARARPSSESCKLLLIEGPSPEIHTPEAITVQMSFFGYQVLCRQL